MRQRLTGIAAAAIVLGAFTPMAYGSVVAHPNYNHRSITVGSYRAGVAGIAAKDGNHFTEFMPIYYLEQGLKKNGFQVSWNGITSSVNITTSQSLQLDQVTPVPGDMHIYINGVCVVNGPKPLDAVDPASGKVTAYVPIYYFNKPLNLLGFTSAYDGIKGTWVVSKSTTAPQIVSANAFQNKVVLQFNQPLKASASPSGLGSMFTILDAGQNLTVAGGAADISGNTVVITLASGTLKTGDRIVATYTPADGGLQTSTGMAVEQMSQAFTAVAFLGSPTTNWSYTSGGLNYLLTPGSSTALPALSVQAGPEVQSVQFYVRLASGNGPAVALGNPVTSSNGTAALPPTSLSGTSLGGLFVGNEYTLYAVGALADGSTVTGPTTSFMAYVPTYTRHAPPAPPTVSNPGYINVANDTKYVVSGTGISNMQIHVVMTDGVGHKVSGTAVVGKGGAWSSVLDTTPLADGPVTITVTQTDSIGYRSAPTTTSVTKDTLAPTAPTNVALTPVGGTVVTNTLNQSNTDLKATADITPGQATGGVAQLYVGSTLVATDSNITASDATVSFDLGTTDASSLEAMVTSSGAATVRLYDAAGNSSSSTGGPTLTVDYTPPTDENTVFGATLNSIFNGENTSITAPGTGETAWMAPAGITLASDLTTGATMTSSKTSTITVPTNPGTYYVYVTDAAGNVSAASTASLTVITPDVDQLSGSGLSGEAGQSIPFSGGNVIEAGETVVLAPSGTAAGALVPNGTTITEASSGNGSITAPTTIGTYDLFAVDSQGNVVAAASKVTVLPDSPVISNTTTDYINTSNVGSYSVSGTGTPGDTVKVTATDQKGTAVSGTVLVANDGTFTLSLNASTLAQGPVQITAVQSSGILTSPASSITVVDDTTPPAAPTNVQATTASEISKNIDVQWTASTSTDVAGYYVLASVDGGKTYTQMPGLELGTSYAYSGSSGGQTVYFRIEAVDVHGNVSPETSAVSGVTPAGVAYKPVWQESSYDPTTNTGTIDISVLDQYGQQINSVSGITVKETQSDSDLDADDHTLTSTPTLTASTLTPGYYEMTFSQQLIDDYDHDSVVLLVVFTGPGGSDQWQKTF